MAASMRRWAGRVALVTGATVGIGAAVARNLVKHGMTVVGCGRRIHLLQDLTEELRHEEGSFHGIQCDMTSEPEILAMFERVKSEHGGVDVLINNAGLAHISPLLSGETKDWKSMLDVNVLALCICAREAFQSMKSRNVDDGHIINMSSLSGHRIINSKNTHFYGATKFAVRAVTEGIRNELREAKSNIRISEVSPGVVETDFHYSLNESQPEKADKLYRSMQCLQAEDIAETIQYILAAPPHVQVQDVLLRSTTQRS